MSSAPAMRQRFAEEALHAAAVGQQQAADAQRRGNQRDEAAVVRDRHLPDLERDRRALARRHAHQAGLGRHGAGQGIEPVLRRGRASRRAARRRAR